MFISAVTLDVLTINTSVLNPSLQEYNGLVDRVNVAKADTEGAIKLINSKSDELEDALKTLKGRLTERWGGTHHHNSSGRLMPLFFLLRLRPADRRQQNKGRRCHQASP